MKDNAIASPAGHHVHPQGVKKDKPLGRGNDKAPHGAHDTKTSPMRGHKNKPQKGATQGP